MRHRVRSPGFRRHKRRADSSDSDGYFQAPLVVRPSEPLRVSPLRDDRTYRSPDTKEYKHASKKRRPPSLPPSESSNEKDEDESANQSESSSSDNESESEGDSGGTTDSDSDEDATESDSDEESSSSEGEDGSEASHSKDSSERRRNDRPPLAHKPRSRSPIGRRVSPVRNKESGRSSPSRVRPKARHHSGSSLPSRSPDRKRKKENAGKSQSSPNGHRKEKSPVSHRRSQNDSRREHRRSRERQRSPARRNDKQRKESPERKRTSVSTTSKRHRESPRRRGPSPSRRDSPRRSRPSSPHRTSRRESPRRKPQSNSREVRDDSRDKSSTGSRKNHRDSRRSSPRNGNGRDDSKGSKPPPGVDRPRKSSKDTSGRTSLTDRDEDTRIRNGKKQESDRKVEDSRESVRVKIKQEKPSPDNRIKVKTEPSSPERSKWEDGEPEKSSSNSKRRPRDIKEDPDADNQGRERYRSGKRGRFEERRKNREGGESEDKFEWGKQRDADTKEDEKEPEEKRKPDLGLSGKLAEDTNVFNGVVVKYNEPPEAKKPKRRWRLYVFKGEESLPFIPLHRQSAYLIGRERKVADIPIDHPSCSKQHAVLQYRSVSYERPDGSTGRRVRPYVIDLESANGTFVNNKRIDARRYVELFEQDVIKFGFSSREYVVLPEDAAEVGQKEDAPVDFSAQETAAP